MNKVWKNSVTGRLRMTKPEDTDGWEQVDPEKLTKASERVFLDLESMRSELKAQEERFRKELDEVTKRNIRQPAVEGTKEPVSFRKLIRGIAHGDWRDADYERSVVQPSERVQGAGVDATGGYIVPPEYLGGQFIELLRANAIAYQLPTMQLNNLSGSPISFPSQTGASTAYWTAENTAITASTVTVGQKSMQPHGLKGLTKTSNRLLRMSDPSIDTLLEQDMAAVLGLELSRAFLYGTGASGEPIGVTQTTGITASTISATITPTNLWNMVNAVEAGNVVVDASAAFCLNPQEWNQLRVSTSVVQAGVNRTTSGVAPMISKDLGGIPIYVSTQVTADTAIFGVWRHAVVGRWGGLEIMASPHADTAFAADQTWIRAVMDVDFCFRQPTAFCTG